MRAGFRTPICGKKDFIRKTCLFILQFNSNLYKKSLQILKIPSKKAVQIFNSIEPPLSLIQLNTNA